ncbi:translation initiation factor eIF4e [Panus rudis PR-1116 ss-1]|nr:translation initiation factor eIF4e [Panus rudis PR-1116 ss-1]
MAGYFSNHSQSRFLNNTNSGSTTTGSSTATATTTAPAQSPLQSSASTPTRPARVPSRHFSTSVSSSDEKTHSKEKSGSGGTSPTNGNSVHPLRHTWVFWFRQHRAPGNKITNYEEGIKKISDFRSVESFWSIWTHLNAPSSLLPTTDYLLFHSGIRRPVWEDPLNLGGGKWIIRVKKGVADRLWEDLVLAIIGDQFDDVTEDKESGKEKDKEKNGTATVDGNGDEWPEICGCTISVRQNEDIITVWNKTDSDAKVKEKINQTMRRVLNLPSNTNMEYKSNNDSMQDKSSFRVPAADRTPLS